MLRLLLIGLMTLCLSYPAWADPKNVYTNAETPVSARCVTSNGLNYAGCGDSETSNAGEDVANDVQKVETRITTIPQGGTTAKITSDQLYRSGPGWLHYLTCHSDATATAGTIAVLDNTAAGAGNVLYQFDVLAVAYTTPFQIFLNTPFSVGLYLDFTTTTDVSCTLGYR